MAGRVGTGLKDYLAKVGVEPMARRALWWVRYHRRRLTGSFIMTPQPLPGVAAGPRVVEIPLASISHVATKLVWDRYYRDAFVFAGNWDERIKRRRAPFDEHPPPLWYDLGGYAHHTVLDVFTRDRHYRETAEYVHLAERIDRGGRPRGCSSRDDLDAHFEQLIADYERMREGVFGRPGEDGRIRPHQVNVFVDRVGDVIHRSQGMHQLRMAELLGLERVPIRVLAVHADWARSHLERTCGHAEDAVGLALSTLGRVEESPSIDEGAT